METPWGDCRVSDAHIHFFSRRFVGALAGQSGNSAEVVAQRLGWELPPEDPAELACRWASELDRHGVARSALIASVPGDESSVKAALKAAPGRFFGYFMANPVDLEAAQRISAIFERGMQVACLFPAMHQYSVHDQKVQP